MTKDLLHVGLGVVMIVAGLSWIFRPSQLGQSGPEDSDAAHGYQVGRHKMAREAGIIFIVSGLMQIALGLTHFN